MTGIKTRNVVRLFGCFFTWKSQWMISVSSKSRIVARCTTVTSFLLPNFNISALRSSPELSSWPSSLTPQHHTLAARGQWFYEFIITRSPRVFSADVDTRLRRLTIRAQLLRVVRVRQSSIDVDEPPTTSLGCWNNEDDREDDDDDDEDDDDDDEIYDIKRRYITGNYALNTLSRLYVLP